jgi:hypothetical protein
MTSIPPAKQIADAYLAEMQDTGGKPSKRGMWEYAKGRECPVTRQELWKHFPADVRLHRGRPRGESRSEAPTVVVTDASLAGAGTPDDPLRVADLDGGDY